jgi:hypothetical protein
MAVNVNWKIFMIIKPNMRFIGIGIGFLFQAVIQGTQFILNIH